jgi:hypothetical protein
MVISHLFFPLFYLYSIMPSFFMPADAPTFTQIQSSLQTGDIVLFHSTDAFSEDVEKRTNSVFSHIGMVVLLPSLSSEPLLWHCAPGPPLHPVHLPPDSAAPPSAIALNGVQIRSEAKNLDSHGMTTALSFALLRHSVLGTSDATQQGGASQRIAGIHKLLTTTDAATDNNDMNDVSKSGENPSEATQSESASTSTSTSTSTSADTERSFYQYGVKLELLPEYLAAVASLKNRTDQYRNDISCAYRKLSLPTDIDILTPLQDCIRAADGKPFPYPATKIWDEYAQGKQGISTGTETCFCSELIAETYIQCGLLAATLPPNAYMPADLSSHNVDLSLLQGATLGAEQWFSIDGLSVANNTVANNTAAS